MGISTPNIPVGTSVSELLGHEVVGNAMSTRRFTRQSVLASFMELQAGGGVIFASLAQASANLGYASNQFAQIVSDSDKAKNGVYRKSGAAGVGSWVRVGDLPYELIRMTVTGGTENAITASLSPQEPSNPADKLYILVPIATNTDAVTINGASVKNAINGSLVEGSLLAGLPVMMIWTIDHYQLLVSVPVDGSGILPDVLAARDAAVAAAAAIDLPPVAADAFVVGNAGASARINKTPAEARVLLQAPSFDDLPFVLAIENGVPGDGTDQTGALQAIVDALPDEGGNILLKGEVRLNTGMLDLSNRRNIRFLGESSMGAGAQQLTIIRCDRSASAGTVIDLSGSTNVSWERLYFYAPQPGFDGVFLKYGVRDDVAAKYMSVLECFLLTNGASGTMLDLSGGSTGSFERSTFSGKGRHVLFQVTAGVSYCNVHNFRRCAFNPIDQYPIIGSGEAIAFDSCNWQAGSSDGKGRAMQSYTGLGFVGLTLKDCGFYDVTASGGEWFILPLGAGLTVIGGRMAGNNGVTQYGFDLGGVVDPSGDPEQSGVRGVTLIGGSYEYLTAVIAFGAAAGAPADGSTVRGIVTGGARTLYAPMYANLVNAGHLVNLGHAVYDNPNSFDAGFAVHGLPSAAGSLTSGRVYVDGGTLKVAS